MSKNSSIITRRACRLLRLALLWARRSRLAVSLNILQKVIRKLVHPEGSRRALAYGDHEFSFDDTPVVHVKMHRPPPALRFRMPCIRPQVDFDCDVREDDDDDDEAVGSDDDDQECILAQIMCILGDVGDDDCDEGIDARAEEFIARFYQQMKLQRQMSYLEYDS